MLAKTHLIFGVGSVAVVSHLGLIDASAGSFIVAMVGSLLPDIDHPGSTFGRKVKPISSLISGIFGHRGITHSALAVATLGAVMAWNIGSMPGWVVYLIIGYLSHLLADWLTPMGIPLLWPNKAMFRSPVTIKTGGAGEVILNVAIISAFAFLWLHSS